MKIFTKFCEQKAYKLKENYQFKKLKILKYYLINQKL